MTDDMGEPDIQRFDSDGTWVKPPGAVRLTVSLKGGTGDNALLGLRAFPHTVAYGGGGGGGVSHSYVVGGSGSTGEGGAGGGGAIGSSSGKAAGGGEEGQLVECSFAADEVPDQMDVKIGQGGYAVITAHLER